MRDLPRGLVCLTVAIGVCLTSPNGLAAPAEPVEPVERVNYLNQGEAPSEPASVEGDPASAESPAEPVPEDDTLPNVDDPELDPSRDEVLEVVPPPPEPEPEPEPEFDQDLDDADLDEDLDQDESASIDDDYDLTRDSPEARSARRWLGAGIGATITGAVLVGGAIAMSQTSPCDPATGNNCFADARDRAAVTMGVPGGVLLLGGIAMTVVGALQKRRIKAGLALAPGQFGVVVVGRF